VTDWGIQVPPGGGAGGGSGTTFLRRDGTLAMLGNLDMGGQSIVDMASITTGDIVLDSTVNPPNPVAGDVGLCAINTGYISPAYLQPDGYKSPIQDAFWGGNAYAYAEAGPSAVNFFGDPFSVGDTSTQAGVASATTNDYTRLRRVLITSAAAAVWRGAGFIASTQATNQNYWLGNAANLGGFFFMCSFSPDTWVGNGGTLFIGMSTYGNLAAGNGGVVQDPSTRTNNFIGLCCDSGDSSVCTLAVGDASGTPTKTTITGMPTLASAMNPLRFFLYLPPNAAKAFYRIDQLSSGVWTNVANTSIPNTTAHFPSNAVYMSPNIGISSGTVAATCKLAMGKMYLYGMG
jgi:hypothetical protein